MKIFPYYYPLRRNYLSPTLPPMFQKMILEGQAKFNSLEVKQRNYQWYDDFRKLNKIITFVGPRRVGKTYLMLDFVKRLIQQKKLSREQVVFMDFSLRPGEYIDPLQLIESYHSKYPHSQPFFVLDEVQDIANMQELVLFLFTHNYKVFLSGSNSKVLSSELSTQFRGKVIEYQVYPLTYPEILSFRGISTDQPFASRERGMIKNLYQNIFTFGSFPEVVLADHEFPQREALKSYYNILMYRDLLERYGIENETAIQYLLKSLTLSFTKEVNIHKVYNDLKSQNVKIGKDTLYEYYQNIKKVFFGYELENIYAPLRGNKKFYLYNLGFHTILGTAPDFGQSFENVLFLELKKKFDHIFFKKGEKKNAEEGLTTDSKKQGGEIDFYLEARDTHPFNKDFNIQACYQLTKENLEREIGPLLKAKGKNSIVYFEKEADLPNEQDGIKIMSFFDFVKEYCN